MSRLISAVALFLATLVPGAAVAQTKVFHKDGRNPAFSADGQFLAYSKAGRLAVIDLKSGRPVKVRPLEGGAGFRWSPDGKRLVFQRYGKQGGREIWVANADGSNPVRVTPPGPTENLHPCWAPDSARIIWSRGSALWIMNADGTGAKPLTPRPAKAFEFCGDTSPDGRTLAYAAAQSSGDPGGTSYRIWLLDLETGEQRPFPQSIPADHIRWSADGRWLYYGTTQGERLMRVPAGGGIPEAVVPFDTGCGGGDFDVARDGSHVLFENGRGPDCDGGLFKASIR